MLSAAIDLWLLPATMFFDAFLPAPKPAAAIIIPLTPAAQRIRRKRKIVRSKSRARETGLLASRRCRQSIRQRVFAP